MIPHRAGWARHPLDRDAGSIITALERSATVELITTGEPDLVHCDAAMPLADALADPALGEFDYVPVRRDDRVAGLLRRAELAAAKPRGARPGLAFTVADAMQPLDESILISAEAGLLTFISHADRHPCRLVIKGSRIAGIVTISDLQKLAVRPVLFVLVTHVELLLLEVLRRRFRGTDDWVSALNPERCGKVENKWRKLRNGNMAIDRLSATEFGDKVDVLLRVFALDDIQQGQARRELVMIEELRNSVAHAGDYALTPTNALKTVETVRLAKEWVERLERLQS